MNKNPIKNKVMEDIRSIASLHSEYHYMDCLSRHVFYPPDGFSDESEAKLRIRDWGNNDELNIFTGSGKTNIFYRIPLDKSLLVAIHFIHELQPGACKDCVIGKAQNIGDYY